MIIISFINGFEVEHHLLRIINIYRDNCHYFNRFKQVDLYQLKITTMTENNQTITTLHNLLDYDASKFTSAEIHLRNSLPDWINRSGSLMLKTVLQKYLDFIQHHVQMMEKFFEQEKINSLSLHNRVMHAFIEETNEKLFACTDPEIKDACLLAGIQVINHYKISIYGTAAAFANALGMEKHAAVFYEAEGNEKQIDSRLSQLAEFEINKKARAPIVLNG
jgi:ferritin-like metal-binding protein YciE